MRNSIDVPPDKIHEIDEVDVEGLEVEDGIFLMGDARRQDDGTWRCLANYYGMLVLAEVRVTFHPVEKKS